MKKLLIILGFILLLICNTAVGQRYDDWTGFSFVEGRLDDKGRVIYYEMLKDYTIDLSDYFEVADDLPDAVENRAAFYRQWADYTLPWAEWDFISFELDGKLTIKKGYRWDGASRPCKEWEHDDLYCPDEYHNFRSSCVHDVLYDLMRMGYHEADHYHGLEIVNGTCEDLHLVWEDGDYNRRMADIMHYIIQMEDNFSKDDAQSDYFWLRLWGACPSHDDDKLCGWKYHVSDLTAYTKNGAVKLKWLPPNVAQKDPDYDGHFDPLVGYSIERNGVEIATVDAFEWVYNPPFPPYPMWVTKYIDTDVENGNLYRYQIRPQAGNKNQDDWSNFDYVVPTQGPGNALKLDGVNDYLEANTVSNDLASRIAGFLADRWTYEAWVYPENKDGAILSLNTMDGGDLYMLYYDAGQQKFCHYDTTHGIIQSTDDFPRENWYHVAVPIDVNEEVGNLYVNGDLQATFDAARGSISIPECGSLFSIGQEWTSTESVLHFKGKIDEVRVWKNVARTQAEIQNAMYIPLIGDEEGLVGLWHFDEPIEVEELKRAYDATRHANDGRLYGYSYTDIPFVPSGAMKQPTDIKELTINTDNIPAEFELHQNYPNPFNPSTKIEFAIPRAEFVTVDIFNILGKKVETLVSKQLTAGNYSVTWDATKASSGVYLYKINAGQFSESKKMTLIK